MSLSSFGYGCGVSEGGSSRKGRGHRGSGNLNVRFYLANQPKQAHGAARHPSQIKGTRRRDAKSNMSMTSTVEATVSANSTFESLQFEEAGILSVITAIDIHVEAVRLEKSCTLCVPRHIIRPILHKRGARSGSREWDRLIAHDNQAYPLWDPPACCGPPPLCDSTLLNDFHTVRRVGFAAAPQHRRSLTHISELGIDGNRRAPIDPHDKALRFRA